MKDMKLKFDVIIVGGGAAGFTTALSIIRPDLWPAHFPRSVYSSNNLRPLRILLIEAQSDLLRKLAATGNGRCNLGNLHVTAADYPTFTVVDGCKVDGCKPDDLTKDLPVQALNFWSPRDTVNWFLNMGLALTAEEGRLYPYTKRAASVRDVMLNCFWSSQRDNTWQNTCEVYCDTAVKSVSYDGNKFKLLLSSDRCVITDKLVLAAGGEVQPSGKHFAGSGLALAESLGLVLDQPRPALVPLQLKHPLKRVAGLRCHGKLTVRRLNRTDIAGADGIDLFSDQGEILFTDYGLSGIPALSCAAALGVPAGPESVTVASDSVGKKGGKSLLEEVAILDFFPEWSEMKLSAQLVYNASVHAKSTFSADVDYYQANCQTDYRSKESSASRADIKQRLSELSHYDQIYFTENEYQAACSGLLDLNLSKEIWYRLNNFAKPKSSDKHLTGQNYQYKHRGDFCGVAVENYKPSTLGREYRQSIDCEPVISVAELSSTLKHFVMLLAGTKDYSNAQTNAGGLKLKQFKTNFEAKNIPGLYAVGEILSVTGVCGGYNLHWAWASGSRAGLDLLRRYAKETLGQLPDWQAQLDYLE